jgi:SET domain-containing protein
MRLLESSTQQKPTSEDPNSRNASIRKVRGRGRCVFARRKIAPGEVIERAPVIVIPKKQWPSVKKSILENYAFDWGENDEDSVIALGYVSIYAHSYSPNAKLEQLTDDLLMEVTALKPIQPGEEITINYNGDPTNRDRLWFKVRK